MAKKTCYAVKKGKTQGIFMNWEDCKAQVDGYSGAEYKGFSDIQDAYNYLQTTEEKQNSSLDDAHTPEGAYVFIDGSYNLDTGRYGYGGFLDVNGYRYPLTGSDNDPGKLELRNVAGEMEGVMAAVKKAEELELRQLTILYDYKGLECWATGEWKTENQFTKEYQKFMNPENRKVDITFQKVKAHTGVEFNEVADLMAKSAVGISLTKTQQERVENALDNNRREGYPIDEENMKETDYEYE